MAGSMDTTMEDHSRRIYRLEQGSTTPSNYPTSNEFDEIYIGPANDRVRLSKDVAPPTNVQVVVDAYYENVFAEVSWNAAASDQINEYEAELAERSGVNYTIIDVQRTVGLDARFDNLKPNSDYGIRIRGINRIGVWTEPTAWLDFTTGKDTTIPSQVVGLQLTKGYSSLVAQWGEVVDIDVQGGRGTYEIHLDTDSLFGAPRVQFTSGTILSWADLQPNSTYYARVRAIDSSGNLGQWSATVSVGTDRPIDVSVIEDRSLTGQKIEHETLSSRHLFVDSGKTAPGNLLLELGTTVTISDATSAAAVNDKLRDVGSPYASFGVGNSSDIGPEGDYVQVDLGVPYIVRESRIYFYSGNDRHYWYKIKYSIDGSEWFYAVGNADTWITSAEKTNPDNNPTTDNFDVPITARYVRLYANGSTSNAGNHVYEWELYSAHSTHIHGGLILTDTVVARHIAANSITSAKIQAGQISSDHIITAGLDAGTIKFGSMSGDRISANTLNVDAIKTSTLTAGNITLSGGSIRIGTNPLDTGILIYSGGIRLYQGGALNVNLSSAGSATFKGSITSGSSISGATITGGVVRTATSGRRVELTGGDSAHVTIFNSSGLTEIKIGTAIGGYEDLSVLASRGGYFYLRTLSGLASAHLSCGDIYCNKVEPNNGIWVSNQSIGLGTTRKMFYGPYVASLMGTLSSSYEIGVVDTSDNSFYRGIRASAYNTGSSTRENKIIKGDVKDPISSIRTAPAKLWSWPLEPRTEGAQADPPENPDNARDRVGPMWEDAPDVIKSGPGFCLDDMVGLLWAGEAQLAEKMDSIMERLDALERRSR